MLHTFNGEARKLGTWPTRRFQVRKTSLKIPYFLGDLSHACYSLCFLEDLMKI